MTINDKKLAKALIELNWALRFFRTAERPDADWLAGAAHRVLAAAGWPEEELTFSTDGATGAAAPPGDG